MTVPSGNSFAMMMFRFFKIEDSEQRITGEEEMLKKLRKVISLPSL